MSLTQKLSKEDLKNKPEILVISDGRAGNDSQLIGLACSMKLKYEIVNISYNFFAFLPNILLPVKNFMIDKISAKKLLAIDFVPRFILSAGRRSAPIALYLKEKFSKEKSPKIIQIMNPNLDFKKFDLILLPRHDFKNQAAQNKYDNVVPTIGSLNKINDLEIKKAALIFKKEFERKFLDSFLDSGGQKKIALLVGGSSKDAVFDEESALKLAKIASKICNQMKAILIVLTSRRTGPKITGIIKSNLDCKNQFFSWDQVATKNPYLGILGYSDFFIVTADSVSMCSECCSTGRPVYIFDNKKISSKKHKRFYQDLFAKNYARMLDDNLMTLQDFGQKKLSQNVEVAEIINKKFGLYH
jgi:mitochondrial fission protein ELM1